MNEDYRQGYKDGFDDGYEKGKREAPLPNPLKPIWDQVSEFLYPEYYIHPQLFMQVMRPGDEGMFVHAEIGRAHV